MIKKKLNTFLNQIIKLCTSLWGVVGCCQFDNQFDILIEQKKDRKPNDNWKNKDENEQKILFAWKILKSN